MILRWVASTEHGHMWQNWFRFRTPEALVDLLSFELLASFLADFFATVR